MEERRQTVVVHFLGSVREERQGGSPSSWPLPAGLDPQALGQYLLGNPITILARAWPIAEDMAVCFPSGTFDQPHPSGCSPTSTLGAGALNREGFFEV